MTLRLQKLSGNILHFVDPADQRRALFVQTVPNRLSMGGKRYPASKETLRITLPHSVADGDRTFIYVGQAKLEITGFNESHKNSLVDGLIAALTTLKTVDYLKGATAPLTTTFTIAEAG